MGDAADREKKLRDASNKAQKEVGSLKNKLDKITRELDAEKSRTKDLKRTVTEHDAAFAKEKKNFNQEVARYKEKLDKVEKERARFRDAEESANQNIEKLVQKLKEEQT